MSYNVKDSAGNTLVIVPDRYIDTDTTSLALLGYNATAYGLHHAENFVHLLEHFANDVPPLHPMTGQLWFDTDSNMMKVFNDGKWTGISGSPTTGGDANQGGIAGVYHCPIEPANTSVLLLFAGGLIVTVVASKDIIQEHLPPQVSVNGTNYDLRSLFPFGLQGGVNLSDANGLSESADYVFAGRVPLSEQAHFAGGGSTDAEVSGWGYIDIGPAKSVGLMISNGQVVAAVSSAIVLNSDLPSSATFYINKDRQDDPVTVQIKSSFPGQIYKKWTVNAAGMPVFDPAQNINDVALFPGITFALSANLGGSLGQIVNGLVASSTSAQGTAVARAFEELKVVTDANSATASKITQLEASFTSATGTTSLASAVQSLIARASDTSAAASLVNKLTADFTTALGANTFADAMTRLSAVANSDGAQSEAITKITSAFTDRFGGQSIAEAVSKLYTSIDANTGDAVVGYTLDLNSNGYVTGIQAANGGASANFFKVTSSKFIIGDNNIDFIPFEVRDGVVYIKNAAIENLTLGGEKIAPGAITQTYAAGWTGSVPGGNWNGVVLNGYMQTPSFIATGVPAFSRALITVNACGRQTGSTDDPFGVGVQKTYWNGSSFVVSYLPYAPIFNFSSGKSISQSWTFVDDNIDAAMATQPITYQIAKVSGVNAGVVTQLAITGFIGKK